MTLVIYLSMSLCLYISLDLFLCLAISPHCLWESPTRLFVEKLLEPQGEAIILDCTSCAEEVERTEEEIEKKRREEEEARRQGRERKKRRRE